MGLMLAAVVLIAVGVCLLSDWIARLQAGRVIPPTAIALGSDHSEQRTSTVSANPFPPPDFTAVEEALGRPLPRSYREMQRDPQLMLSLCGDLAPPGSTDPDKFTPVSRFLPANRDAISGQWSEGLLREGLLPIAIDGNVGTYSLDMDRATADDAPVVWDADGEGVVPVAPSLREFLQFRPVDDW